MLAFFFIIPNFLNSQCYGEMLFKTIEVGLHDLIKKEKRKVIILTHVVIAI